DQLPLEVVDDAVPLLDPARRYQPVYPYDEHVLVVRAVERAHVPGLGQLPADAPEEVVPALLRGRYPEARHPHAGRVEQADDALDRAVLAAAVHRLQEQQDPAPVTALLGGG